MRRREFITMLGGAAAWPLAARAQQGERIRRIGVLMAYAETDPARTSVRRGIPEGLQKLGWTEGRNIRIDTRWATPGDAESMQHSRRSSSRCSPISILSSRHTDHGGAAATNAHHPHRFRRSYPIRSAGLRRELRSAGRQRHRLHRNGADHGRQVAGAAQGNCAARQPVALLFNPATAPYAEYWLNPFKAAAESFGVQAIAASVHDTSELESVVAAQARQPNGGLIVMPDTFMSAHRAEITALAARDRLPAVYPFRFFAEIGGLMSYGTDLADDFRRAATYVDRILKGAKPSELPVAGPDQVRAGHQPQDRQGARPRRSADPARPRRRGDRIEALFAAVHESASVKVFGCRPLTCLATRTGGRRPKTSRGGNRGRVGHPAYGDLRAVRCRTAVRRGGLRMRRGLGACLSGVVDDDRRGASGAARRVRWRAKVVVGHMRRWPGEGRQLMSAFGRAERASALMRCRS